MPIIRDDAEERMARIDHLLEELRLNTEDLHELARHAFQRAQMAVKDASQITDRSKQVAAEARDIRRKK